MTDIDDPFERLAFNADGRLVDSSPGVVPRPPIEPPQLVWVQASQAARRHPITNLIACKTDPGGTTWDQRVVSEPFEQGGVEWIYCALEGDFWRWWLTPAQDRTERPRAQCWQARHVWILEQANMIDGTLPPDPFI